MQHADVRVIREVLEGELSSAQTSAVLFEALDSAEGSIPQSGDELRALVHGPLSGALERHVGDDRTREILAAIERRLSLEDSDASGTRPRSRLPSVPPAAPRDDATTAVPTAKDPVSVAVVASSESFARRLGVVLGPRRVAPFSVASVDVLWGLDASPALVLVDCTDFAPIEADDLSRVLAALPPTTVRVVWGSNLPYGRSLLRALSRDEVPHTPIDRKEGIEPLLDLIRARQRT